MTKNAKKPHLMQYVQWLSLIHITYGILAGQYLTMTCHDSVIPSVICCWLIVCYVYQRLCSLLA